VKKMPILYSLVSRESCVLAEFTSVTGNFQQVTRLILQKLPKTDDEGHASYSYDEHVFHVLQADSLIFLAMSDTSFERRIAYAYLGEIKTRFFRSYGDIGKTALAYAMNKSFSRVLKEQMDFFSNSPDADKLRKVQAEINEVKSTMVENIEKVIDRGEKIELLVDKAENLQDQAFKFKKQAKAVKQKYWWQNMKMMAILGCLILVCRLLSCFSQLSPRLVCMHVIRSRVFMLCCRVSNTEDTTHDFSDGLIRRRCAMIV